MLRGGMLLLSCVIFLSGCQQPQSQYVDYKPTASAAITLAVLRKPIDPAPAPAPVDGDKCPDCGGTGKVGDGTVFVKCKACNGTGKIGMAPTEDVADVADEKAAAAPEQVCKAGCENGQCQQCNANCPQCVSATSESGASEECLDGSCSQGSYRYVPRLFGRWRR